MEDLEAGIKIVDDEEYYNMGKAAKYLRCSPQGWRNLTNKLVKKGELTLWKFKIEPKSVYIKKKDLLKLLEPIAIQPQEWKGK